MHTRFYFVIWGLLLLFFVLFSCTENVSSKPNFVFKQAPKTGVVAKVLGVEITEGELYKGIESDIYDAEIKLYELKMNRLKALALDKLMIKHPKRDKLSNDEFMDQVIVKNKSVSEAVIQKFIKERKIPKEHITPQMTERIKKFLMVEVKKSAIDSWLGKETKKSPIEVYLKKPRRPIFNVKVGNSPFMGGADAKITIVEFTDFECPFCSRGANTMTELKNKYGNKIKVVFKNYPLPFHNNAKTAANAAFCAREHGEKYFWKLHDKLFENQSKLNESGILSMVKTIGIKDIKKFEACVKGKKHMALVDQDMKEALEIGVKSTPTFFVNGRMITGALSLHEFVSIIDEQLK